MKFKLKETVLTLREQAFTVRELTHGERHQWVKVATQDPYLGPSLLVKLGTVSPFIENEQEIEAWPDDVVRALSAKIMELSGLQVKKDKEGGAEKQT